MLVYSQTGLETTQMAQRIERVARASGNGASGLRVLVDDSDNLAWQWRWYLRDYPLVTYQALNGTTLAAPPQADVVVLSIAAEERNQQVLAGFTKVGPLHQLWWFPNTAYAGLSPAGLLRGVTERKGWKGVLDYFFFRRFGTAMYNSTASVYVANAYSSTP